MGVYWVFLARPREMLSGYGQHAFAPFVASDGVTRSHNLLTVALYVVVLTPLSVLSWLCRAVLRFVMPVQPRCVFDMSINGAV